MSTPDIKHVKVERIVVLEDSSIVIHHTGGGQWTVGFGNPQWLAMDEYLCKGDQNDNLGIPIGSGAYVWMEYPEVYDAMKAACGVLAAQCTPTGTVAEVVLPPIAAWTHITADPEANVEVFGAAGGSVKLDMLSLFQVMRAASGEDESLATHMLGDPELTCCALLDADDCRQVVTLIRQAIASGKRRILGRFGPPENTPPEKG